MKYNSYYGIFFTAISLLLLIQIPVQADMREINGVPFYVEKIENRSDGLVLLAYESEKKLVKKDDLDEAILEMYFGPEPTYNLSSSQLKKFISSSLINGKLDYAKRAVNALIENSSLSEENVGEFLGTLPDHPETLDFLYHTYSLLQKKNIKKELQNNIFLIIGVKDSRWLSENSVNLSDEDKAILEGIVDTYFGSTFVENDMALRNKILFFEKKVFGVTSSIYQKHVEINKNVALILPQLQKFNFFGIHRLIQLIQRDRELYVVLMPFVRERLHACVKNALELEKIDKAVEAMSLINPDWRTEDTYLLVKRILNEALKYKNVIFIESGFNDLVSAIALQDQKIKQDYLDLLSKQVDVLLANKYLSNVDQFLGYVTKLRPDPNQENDIIRAKEILFLIKNGQKRTAKEKLLGINTSLPLMMKFRFLISGLYFNIWKYIFAFILLIIAFVLIKILKNPDSYFDKKVKLLFKVNNKKSNEISSDDTYDEPLFVSNNMEVRRQPIFDRYQTCLRELGFPKDVGIKAIKANYRQVMKAYHPDYHPDQTPEEHAKFIELNELYKEVFELRKELGFPDGG